MEIIAYHGWGFGSDFWNPWKDLLPREVIFKTAGRGYFFEEIKPRFSNSESPKILFLHSFGLHWCPPKQIERADCIVIFNGFRTFHPEEEPAKTMSERVLRKMISGFKKDPQKVLSEFWKNTFHPFEASYKNTSEIDSSLLLKDLELLDSSRFNTASFQDGKPIISIDGGRDKILGKPRGKEFTELTKRDAVYHFIQEAGHSLPATFASDCWSFINAMIPIFRNNGNYRKQRYQ
ncbi:MAG: hypothetical protein WD059_11630 [Balneolaceae bacterium]